MNTQSDVQSNNLYDEFVHPVRLVVQGPSGGDEAGVRIDEEGLAQGHYGVGDVAIAAYVWVRCCHLQQTVEDCH